MFNINVNGNPYHVSFYHGDEIKLPVKLPKSGKVKQRHFTACRLKSLENGKEFKALTILNPIDTYSKELGRRYALLHVLNKTDWSKTTRRRIWRDYFEATNQSQELNRFYR